MVDDEDGGQRRTHSSSVLNELIPTTISKSWKVWYWIIRLYESDRSIYSIITRYNAL